MTSSPQHFWVGFDRWVVQDGNYTDFAVGEVRQFALEFYPAGHLKKSGRPERLHRLAELGNRYDVNGQVVRAASGVEGDASVIDFGLLAYNERSSLHGGVVEAGDWLQGEIGLGVDYYAYMEFLRKQPGMPAMIYTWSIDEIRMRGRRDTGRSIQQTDAGNDRGSYLLRCTLLDPDPARRMSRRGRSGEPRGPLSLGAVLDLKPSD